MTATNLTADDPTADNRLPDILVIPASVSSTGELLADAAGRRGIAVERLAGPDVPERLRNTGRAHVYAGPIFAGAVAADLDVALLEADDEWLVKLPQKFLNRDIRMTTLGEARSMRHPRFVKQPRAKDIPAAVYPDGSRLPDGSDLPAGSANATVLVSEIVTFIVEFRLFILDGQVHTASRYATFGHLDPLPMEHTPHRDAVLSFAADLLASQSPNLPSAIVVDVGLATTADNSDEYWAVVEANMAWYSSSYAADIDRVLDVVLRAAGPVGRLADRDRSFCPRPG